MRGVSNLLESWKNILTNKILAEKLIIKYCSSNATSHRPISIFLILKSGTKIFRWINLLGKYVSLLTEKSRELFMVLDNII